MTDAIIRTHSGVDADAGRWQAVLTRDGRVDGAFVYAVGSTGIYCRPSCPSRKPRPDRVTFFESAAEAGWMLRRERWGPAHIQRGSSHLIASSGGALGASSRPGELTASGAHDLAPKEKRDSVHYGGPSCIPSSPNGNPLRWRHLTEISRSACWTMMVSSIRSHLRVTRTGPIGSTLGVRGTSISSRPIGVTGVNSTSRRAEQPRKLQDGTCESRAICWRGRQRLSA